MAIYKRERRPKSYSLKDGQFLIGGQDDFSVDTSGPARKSEIEDTPLEKAGLTNNDPKEEKEKEIKLDEATAQSENIEPKDNVAGTTAIEEDKEKVTNPNATKLDVLLGDLGVKVNNYSGLSKKELKNHPNGDKNLTIDGKPVEYNSSEVSSGGEVSSGLIAASELVLPGMKDLGLNISGGNDAYHLSDQYYSKRMKSDFKSKGWKNDRIKKVEGYTGGEPSLEQLKKFKGIAGKSGHTSGNNLDFTVKDPEAAREKFLADGFKFVEGKDGKPNSYIKDGITILDEYKGKTGGGTGAHFHLEGDKSHKH